MIYFILVFIGVFIYSAKKKKRVWVLPLIGYSWRKFTEKVLQVPSEMAKGFATHPVASLFVISIGLGFCIITRNSDGMSLFTKITLNDLFSIIALPSFLENIPWQQGPTNREYTWKFLLFYSLHFFFLFKVSPLFDKVEVGLICSYFFFFVLRWHNLNHLAQNYYHNKSSAVEMVVPVQDSLNQLFITFHRHNPINPHHQQQNIDDNLVDQNEDEIPAVVVPPPRLDQLQQQQPDAAPHNNNNNNIININTNPLQHNQIPLVGNTNVPLPPQQQQQNPGQNHNNVDQQQPEAGAATVPQIQPLTQNNNNNNNNNPTIINNRRNSTGFGTLTCWGMYPIQKQFSMQVSDDLKSMKFDEELNVLVCTFFRNGEHRVEISRLDLQKYRFNLIKAYKLPRELTCVTNCQGTSNIIAYDTVARAIVGISIQLGTRDPTIHIPFSEPKLLRCVSHGQSQTIIASDNLINVTLFQREKDTDSFSQFKEIVFEEPQIDVISKKGVNKIVFHGDDGLFSFFTPKDFEFIHEFNLFEGIAFQIIDNDHFSIQAFTKLFVMKNYKNPKYVAVIDHFKKIDFTLINKKKHVLFIHSSNYARKSLFQVNQSELKRSLQQQQQQQQQQMQNPSECTDACDEIEASFAKQNKKCD